MTPASTMTVTFFDDFAAQTKREERVSLAELAHRIRTTTAPAKASLPWLKLARFGNARTAKNSLRHDANVLDCTGVEADYDRQEVGFETAVEIAEKAGLGCILYTSPSHTDVRPRWRILAPAKHTTPPQDRAPLLARLNGLYGGIFAAESWTVSQAYYFGSVVGNPTHRVELLDGMPIDELHELDKIAINKPNGGGDARPVPGGGVTASEDAELILRVITGDGFHTELCALAARYIGRAMDRRGVGDTLRGIMLASTGPRDARWHDRFRSIDTLVSSAAQKFADLAEKRRAVARLTHQLIRAGRSGEEIKAAILAEAERRDLAQDNAVAIAGSILNEKIGGQRRA
jgi:hypothetical protein